MPRLLRFSALRSSTALAFLAISNCSFAIEVPTYDRSREPIDNKNVIGIECNKDTKTLKIGYFTAYNLPEKGMDLWDTFSLKTNSKNGRHVKSVHVLTRQCQIGMDQYTVKIRAVPGNWNLNGECGGATYGGAAIFKNGIKIFDENFQECDSVEIITKISISADQKKPLIVKEIYKN